MDTFKCPFCGEELKSMAGMYMCHKDSLFVSPKSRKCEFSAGAPKHLLESYRFINTFRRVQPMFAFSPKKLWEEGFSEADVKFVNCKQPLETVTNYTLSRLNTLSDIKDMHLIGGQGVLADNLRMYFTQAVIQESDTSPLDFVSFPEAGRWLWIKTLLNSVPIADSTLVWRAVGMYFALCPEHALSFISGNIQFGRNPMAYTDEMMLYSYIVNMPGINIPWGKGAAELYANCVNFVKYLTRNLKRIENKPDGYNVSALPKGMQSEKSFFELYMPYLKAQPSLAVNMQSGEIVSYDILDNEFKLSVVEKGEEVGPMELMERLRVNMVLGAMYEKYAAPYLVSFSLSDKVDFCRRNGVTVNPYNFDEAVIKFWETVRTMFEEESTNEQQS